MASVQERLLINRLPLDKWSTREQLCLAFAVSCSGDQNWMSVSRTLKLVCGNATNRPADWYSQKSCAVQYGHLLENVETPKRKKRCSENGAASPATVETPTDLILRRLTEERTQELNAELKREQEEYAKIHSELKTIESGQLSEEQLLDMWREIEQQQERQRIQEMKLENQMRERDQRRQEMQRSWRSTVGATATVAASTLQQKTSTDMTSVDMDVEEIIGTGKPVLSNTSSVPYGPQQQQQTATSPLLSSLLKSPTSSVAPSPGITVVTASGSGSARAAAPTITTLLTSGSIPNTHKPAITIKSNILPPIEAAQLLARPISGPPTDQSPATSAAVQTILSPSQSAPTLSMLLEKTKTTNSANNTTRAHSSPEAEPNSSDSIAGVNVEVDHTIDSNNEEVPMDIEEDVAANVVNTNTDQGSADSDEPDPNEEQQLLEVFKNIGNIDELDIDVAAVIDDGGVDFLKGVDEEPPNDTADVMDFETKLDSEDLEHPSNLHNEAKNELKTKSEMESKELASTIVEDVIVISTEKAADSESAERLKTETNSSDESNDNIPLAAVASLESKERIQNHEDVLQETIFLKEKVESAIKNEDTNASDGSEVTPAPTVSKEVIKDETESNDCKITNEISEKAIPVLQEAKVVCEDPAESENSEDVIVIPTDDESNSENQLSHFKKLAQSQERPVMSEPNDKTELVIESKKEESESIGAADSEVTDIINMLTDTQTQESTATEGDASSCPPPIISIDTDDSCTTDISIPTRKEDKNLASVKLPTAAFLNQQQQRKQLTDIMRNEHKSDEESSVPVAAVAAATPVKTPTLRKLRDRDRSESPMVEDEAATTSDNSTINQRPRRRCSSTPFLDSIPNSPASSDRDEREPRATKKSLLSIYNALQPSKYMSTFQRVAVDTGETPKYSEICQRPMDWQTIKKNIDTGVIRTVSDLQRDVLLMSQNALMVFKTNSTDYKSILTFLQECQGIREFTSNAHLSESNTKPDKETKDLRGSVSSGSMSSLNTSGHNKGRMASRKSQRIS